MVMMASHLAPVGFTLLIWWLSTGVIVYLARLPQCTYRWTFAAFTCFLVGAYWYLAVTANDTSIVAAYGAFTAAIALWAWQEVAFLLGYITGPRRLMLDDSISGWAKFKAAFLTIAHHEIALLILAGAILFLTFGGTNLLGLWTFLILWLMRQSAKLNIFLGVRNFSEAFLPPHLGYLRSYFSHRSMNPLFPTSIVCASTATLVLWQIALHPQLDASSEVQFTFLATLSALGLLEHWLMMLPFAPETLWRWALRKPVESTWKPASFVK
jgi:putative photosynthetic complex assembly protein 2